MLLSTPLSLLLSFSALKGVDDVVVERQFNAVVIQNGLKIEVEGSGPEAYVVDVDGARVPSERTRWQDDVLQILDEDGSVLISLPLSSWGSMASPDMMAQGAIENSPPKKKAGTPKANAQESRSRLSRDSNDPDRRTASEQRRRPPVGS